MVKTSLDGANVKLYFDAPVDATNMTAKVDNGATSAVSYSYAASTNGEYVATFTADSNAKTVGTHNVTVYNSKDYAGNVSNILTGSYTTAVNTLAPSVVSVTQKDSTSFLVKFSSSINNASAGLITAKRGPAALAISGFAQDLTDDSTGNTYKVTVADSAIPVYDADTTSTVIALDIKGYTSTDALVGPEYTGNITLNKDTTAPSVLSSNLNGVNGAYSLTVKFNRAIDSTKLDASKIVVTTGGVIKGLDSSTPVSLLAGHSDTLVITLAANTAKSLYNVQLQSGAVQDLSGNKNVALTTTVDNTGVTPLVITPSEITDANNVFTIDYSAAGEDMNDSAINLSNYTLDGAALPVGTSIGFINNKRTVQITLPSNTIKTSTTSLLAISKLVTSSNYMVENTDKTVCSNLVAVEDNIKPVELSSEFGLANSSDPTTSTVKLTFSEGLGAQTENTSGIYDDFQVKVNGVIDAVTGNSAVNAGDKTITLTLENPVNVNQGSSIAIKTIAAGSTNPSNASISVVDQASTPNVLADGTTIDVFGSYVK